LIKITFRHLVKAEIATNTSRDFDYAILEVGDAVRANWHLSKTVTWP